VYILVVVVRQASNRKRKKTPWDWTLLSKRSLHAEFSVTSLDILLMVNSFSIVNSFVVVSSPKDKGVSWPVQT
jgi:hypothetical protein